MDPNIFARALFVAPNPHANYALHTWENPYNLVTATLVDNSAPVQALGTTLYGPYPVNLLQVRSADEKPPTLIDVLLALVRAYWHRFSQDAKARSVLFSMSDDDIFTKVQEVFTVKPELQDAARAALSLAADTPVKPCAIALTLVRHALLRWATNDWLLRPPVFQTPPQSPQP